MKSIGPEDPIFAVGILEEVEITPKQTTVRMGVSSPQGREAAQKVAEAVARTTGGRVISREEAQRERRVFAVPELPWHRGESN